MFKTSCRSKTCFCRTLSVFLTRFVFTGKQQPSQAKAAQQLDPYYSKLPYNFKPIYFVKGDTLRPPTPPSPVVVTSPPDNKPLISTASSHISNKTNITNVSSKAGPSGVSIKNDIFSMFSNSENPVNIATGSLPSLDFRNSSLSSPNVLNQNSISSCSTSKLNSTSAVSNPVIGELSKKCEALQVSPVSKQQHPRKNLIGKSPEKPLKKQPVPKKPPSRRREQKQGSFDRNHPQQKPFSREKFPQRTQRSYRKEGEMLVKKTKPSWSKSRGVTSVAMAVKKNHKDLCEVEVETADKLHRLLHTGNFRVKLEFWLVHCL